MIPLRTVRPRHRKGRRHARARNNLHTHMRRSHTFAFALMLLSSIAASAQFGANYTMDVEGPAMGELVDLDGDGDKDMLLGTRGGPLVYLNNDGAGNFQLPLAPFGSDHAVVHGADVDGDGLVDVIGSRQGSTPGIDVFINSLQNGHLYASSISTSLSATDIGSGDMDQDGDVDVVVGLGNGQLCMAWNTNGLGQFSALEVVATNSVYTALRTIDIDADGDLDITWYDAMEGAVFLVRCNGTDFDATEMLGNDGKGDLADLDGDGQLDLVSITPAGTLVWRRNLGSASNFGPLHTLVIPQSPAQLFATGDVDGDGDTDVMWSIAQPAGVQWAENLDGAGHFGPVQDVIYLQTAPSDLICADVNGDSSMDLVDVCVSQNQVIWNAGVIVPGGRLVGRVYNDIDGDGAFNGNDHGLQNVMVEIPGTATTWTNAAGIYWFDLPAGTYTVQAEEALAWNATTPVMYTTTVSTMGTNTGIDFGRQAAGTQPAVGAAMYGTPSVCSYASTFWAMIENTGNVPADLHLRVTLDALVTFAGAEPAPDSVVAGVAHWTFAHIVPGHGRTVTIGAQMPGVVNMGDTLHNIADAELLVAGTVLATAQAQNDPMLMSSYDPNDKQVMPAGRDLAHLTAFGERMVYTVRFQNTGNYRAENVVIVDTLDADLDPSTVELISWSHAPRVELVDGVLRFVFEGIMLPDSTSDPLGSQGFVRFAIRHNEGLPEGTLLTNTAHIFFDLNPPIATNTVFNTLTNDLVGVEEVVFTTDMGLRLVPNPAVNEVDLLLAEVPGTAYQVYLFDAMGRAVRYWQAAAGVARLRMPLGGVMPGTYVARVRAMDGGYDRSTRLVVAH